MKQTYKNMKSEAFKNTFDSFKSFIKTYDADTLKEISENGCASGCANGLIYYSDTIAFYDAFCDELHEVLAQDIDQFGEMPRYIADALAQGCTSFKNALVWYVAESYAFELSNQAEEV